MVEKYISVKGNKMSFVHICSATFNRIEYTKEVIDALYSYDAGCGFTLTIVDNGSTDGTREYLGTLNQKIEKHINVILLPFNHGISYAHNLGWYLGPKDYYMKLDNDMVVKKDGWLFELVDCADKIESGGVFGYNVETISFPEQVINGKSCRPKTTGNLGGACFLIPRRTFERLGYWYRFDDRVYGEEDAEYSWRVKHAGLLNIYMTDQDAFVHLPGGKADLPEEEPEYRKFKDDERDKNMLHLSSYRLRMVEVAQKKNLYVSFKP